MILRILIAVACAGLVLAGCKPAEHPSKSESEHSKKYEHEAEHPKKTE